MFSAQMGSTWERAQADRPRSSVSLAGPNGAEEEGKGGSVVLCNKRGEEREGVSPPSRQRATLTRAKTDCTLWGQQAVLGLLNCPLTAPGELTLWSDKSLTRHLEAVDWQRRPCGRASLLRL